MYVREGKWTKNGVRWRENEHVVAGCNIRYFRHKRCANKREMKRWRIASAACKGETDQKGVCAKYEYKGREGCEISLEEKKDNKRVCAESRNDQNEK